MGRFWYFFHKTILSVDKNFNLNQAAKFNIIQGSDKSTNPNAIGRDKFDFFVSYCQQDLRSHRKAFLIGLTMMLFQISEIEKKQYV